MLRIFVGSTLCDVTCDVIWPRMPKITLPSSFWDEMDHKTCITCHAVQNLKFDLFWPDLHLRSVMWLLNVSNMSSCTPYMCSMSEMSQKHVSHDPFLPNRYGDLGWPDLDLTLTFTMTCTTLIVSEYLCLLNHCRFRTNETNSVLRRPCVFDYAKSPILTFDLDFDLDLDLKLNVKYTF